MKHCVYCGGNVVATGKDVYRCNDCKKTHYVNPKVAVALFLRRQDGQFVLARRAHEPEKGKLDCIGGFVDVNESLEEALYREAHEEAGITKHDITEPQYIGSYFNYYMWEGEPIPVTSVYFGATLARDVDLLADDDIASFEIGKADNFDQSQFAWEGMAAMYRQFTNHNY